MSLDVGRFIFLSVFPSPHPPIFKVKQEDIMHIIMNRLRHYKSRKIFQLCYWFKGLPDRANRLFFQDISLFVNHPTVQSCGDSRRMVGKYRGYPVLS